MFEKLQSDYQRFLEIEEALRNPEMASSVSRVTALSKERGTLAKVAIPYGRYLDLGQRIAEAESLRESETDAEMRSYAEAELLELQEQQRREGDNLRDLLYDRQTGADHAGLIVEIRAGTGGAEAALFVRDLFEMYRRFSERMGWKFELMDLGATDLGGFREVSFSVSGDGAFRRLQFESGVHRVPASGHRVPVRCVTRLARNAWRLPLAR